MRVRPGGGCDGDGNEEGKQDLPDIIGFARAAAHEISQRRLQEEEGEDGEAQPFRGADDGFDTRSTQC